MIGDSSRVLHFVVPFALQLFLSKSAKSKKSLEQIYLK